LIVTSLLLVACGSDDKSSDSVAAPGTTEGDETIDIVATDYAFAGMPATVKPGSKFALSNSSDKELHEFVVFKLPEGETRPLAELVALPEAEGEALVGEGPPTMVLIVPPASDEQITAVGDGTVTDPGRYVALCFIPEGADPQKYLEAVQAGGEGPPQVEGGPPHVALGMSAEFTVEG